MIVKVGGNQIGLMRKKLFIKKIEKSYPDLIQSDKKLWKYFKVQTLKKIENLIINNQSKRYRLEISENFILNFQIIIIYFLSFYFSVFFKLLLSLRKKQNQLI